MPRETVLVPFKSLPACEAAAVFFSTIAYPDPLDKALCKNFRIALSRWAILERARIDSNWRCSPQQITPEVFSQEQRHYQRTIETGVSLLTKRIVCANTFVTPHLTKEPLHLFGYAPTVENLAALLAERMGMERGSYKTIELKLWAPTKPVAHAGVALAWFIARVGRQRTIGLDEEEYPLLKHSLLLGLLSYPGILTHIIDPSEHLRRRLPKIKAFRIKEQSTIKFILD